MKATFAIAQIFCVMLIREKGLLDKEFVTRDEKGYVVYDKFFEIWLRGKY